MKKYRFISPMKEKEFEAKAAIHRKKWKAKCFYNQPFFDEQIKVFGKMVLGHKRNPLKMLRNTFRNMKKRSRK